MTPNQICTKYHLFHVEFWGTLDAPESGREGMWLPQSSQGCRVPRGSERAKLSLTTLFWTHPIAGASLWFQRGSAGPVAAVMDILSTHPGSREKKSVLARNI